MFDGVYTRAASMTGLGRKPSIWNWRADMLSPWAQDMARDLVLWPFWGNYQYIGKRYGGVNRSQNVAISTDQTGQVVRNTTVRAALEYSNNSDIAFTAAPFTYFALLRPSVGSGDFQWLMSTTGTSNTNGFRWMLSPGDTNAVRVRTVQSGSGVNVDASISWSADDLLLLFFCYDGTTLYSDNYNLTTGVYSNNSAAESGGMTHGNDITWFFIDFDHITNNDGYQGDMLMAGATPHLWSSSEMDALSRDPFMLLRPDPVLAMTNQPVADPVAVSSLIRGEFLNTRVGRFM